MKKILFLVGLLSTLVAAAQDSPIKDQQLHQLIDKAVANYPRIKELEDQLRNPAIREQIIRTAYQPTVSSDISYRFSAPAAKAEFETPAGKQVLQFTPYNNYTALVGVQQLIYDFGKTKLQLERTRTETQLAEDNLANARNAIAYQVAQVYFNLQFTAKAIAVQKEQISSLKENERIIQAKVNNGDALEYDLLTTQVRTANATNRLADLQSQLQKQYVLIEWLTGESQQNKLSLDGNREDLTLQIVPGEWQKTNAEAIVLNRQIELYNIDVRNATISDRPNLVGSVQTGVRNGYQPEIEKLRGVVDATVGISIPIFTGSRPKLQRQLAQLQVETSRHSLQTLENNIRKDLATVDTDFKTLNEKLTNTNVLVSQAEKAYALAQIRFKEGLITNAELLGTQSNVEDAKLSQVQLQYLMQLDKLESHKIVGTKMY